MHSHVFACGASWISALSLFAALASAQNPSYPDPQNVDDDFAYQGEYVGELTTQDGARTVGTQILALGQGKFRGIMYPGGLPGAGWNGNRKFQLETQRDKGSVTFGSHKVHIEFRLPYQPQDRGQKRGNSGIYLQGRYEVQMLDSFGLEGKHNECGGIYEVRDPDVNMCLPPLSWQTYDIEFSAARFGKEGQVTAAPRISVYHNGVMVHRDVQLPTDRATRSAPQKPGPAPGPVYLQDHGNPVRYRNIWVVEAE